jgi:hypothetical protein
MEKEFIIAIQTPETIVETFLEYGSCQPSLELVSLIGFFTLDLPRGSSFSRSN